MGPVYLEAMDALHQVCILSMACQIACSLVSSCITVGRLLVLMPADKGCVTGTWPPLQARSLDQSLHD